MRLLSRPLSRRRGSILPLIVLLMASLLTMAAFAIDYGWLVMVRTELQLTAVVTPGE